MAILSDTFAEFFTSETADHGLSFLRDYDGYMAALVRLFDKAGLPHDKTEADDFIPEVPPEDVYRPGAMPEGEIYSVN